MSINEFQHQIFEVALSSSICSIPVVLRISPTSINMRVPIITGNFIDIFYNEQTGRVAFALIQEGQRIYVADNTGGWHIHPFDNPSYHNSQPTAISFTDFVREIEKFYNQL